MLVCVMIAALWDFKSYVPDAVTINLGTNDYRSTAAVQIAVNRVSESRWLCSTQPHPPAETFVPGYRKFIAKIRSGFLVFVLATCEAECLMLSF